jgi:flavin-dependent dehydrogenase
VKTARRPAQGATPRAAPRTAAARPPVSARAAVVAPPAPALKAEVLVLGSHPSAYLAAILLHAGGKLPVVHCTVPDERNGDRLVVINPDFFSLHPLLEPLRRKLEMTPIYGIQFLSDNPAVKSEHRSKSALAYVACYRDVQSEMARVAAAQGVPLLTPKQFQILGLDEKGLEVALNQKTPLRPKVLVLSGTLDAAHQKMLGLPESWGADVVHRYTYVRLPGTKWADTGQRPTMPMSLNLKETLCWGWLLPGPKSMQLAVEQPLEALAHVRPADLLAHWAGVLRAANILTAGREVPLDQAESIDLPLAGALAQEGVANRTLLIGPAGGFYSACTEDIYPNCWSALFAADAVKKALKEPHLQDALQPYRAKWRTTLGEYLRGPQQNFRFLLPLVYRNDVMTTRLTECILLGKSVVR